jgi:hypothetical protein
LGELITLSGNLHKSPDGIMVGALRVSFGPHSDTVEMAPKSPACWWPLRPDPARTGWFCEGPAISWWFGR